MVERQGAVSGGVVAGGGSNNNHPTDLIFYNVEILSTEDVSLVLFNSASGKFSGQGRRHHLCQTIRGMFSSPAVKSPCLPLKPSEPRPCSLLCSQPCCLPGPYHGRLLSLLTVSNNFSSLKFQSLSYSSNKHGLQ